MGEIKVAAGVPVQYSPMSIRTYIDNSLFHSVHEWSEHDKNLVEACNLVYGNKVQVLTPENFFTHLRKTEGLPVHPSTISG